MPPRLIAVLSGCRENLPRLLHRLGTTGRLKLVRCRRTTTGGDAANPVDRARFRRQALTAGLALVLAGCVGPARTATAYRGKASSTVGHVRSSVLAVIIATEAGARHDLPTAYLSVVLGEAEEDASAAVATFASIQPPDDRSDQLRSSALEVVDGATDLLATARIRIRRGRLDAVVEMLPALRRSASELDRREQDLRGA